MTFWEYLGTRCQQLLVGANQRMQVLVLGFVLTVAMALIMDWLGTLVGLPLRPRGLEVD